MNDRKKLIEEAAKAIYENERRTIDPDWPAWEDCRDGSKESVLDAARDAFAVFEKAHAREVEELVAQRNHAEAMCQEWIKVAEHTPADDERKTVSGLIWGDADVAEEIDITEATDRLIAYFRHSEAHTPTDDEREALVRRAIRAADEADECGDPVMEAWSDGERFTSDDLCTLAAGFRLSGVPEPSADPDGLCGDWPAPCNCDDPTTHDGSVPASLVRSEQGEPSDAQVERERIIADLREWSRPLGTSPEEETLRLVIERIERATVTEQGENREEQNHGA